METRQQTRPSQAPKQPSGMKCPQCGNLIPISMKNILEGNPIMCPSCGLILNIDKSKSSKAIDALKKVEEELNTKEQEETK